MLETIHSCEHGVAGYPKRRGCLPSQMHCHKSEFMEILKNGESFFSQVITNLAD